MKGWRWLAPATVVLLLVTVWPFGRAVWLSLSSYSLADPTDRTSVGFDNYVDILTNRSWWIAVTATLATVLVVVLLQVAIGLGFAAALRRATVAWPITCVLLLVPFVMLAVVSAVLWRDAVTTGFAASWFDYEALGPWGQLVTVALSEVWRGVGITTVILLAGMMRVSPSLLESAVADGASAGQRIRRVVLPAMGPAIAVAVTFRAFDALRAVEGPLLVDNARSQAHTVAELIWDTTFSRSEVGLGAAMSVLLLALAGLVALVLRSLLRVRRAV